MLSDGKAEFRGIDTRVKGPHQFKLSNEQYRRVLEIFDEVNFTKLQSGPLTFMGGWATVTLDRDSNRKSVSFPSIGGTGREYAILITSIEEVLQLRDLT